jgi:hypothetical protein
MMPEPISAVAAVEGVAKAAGTAVTLWKELAGNPADGLPASQVRPRALQSADGIVQASADLLALARPLDDEFDHLGPVSGELAEADKDRLKTVADTAVLTRIGSEGPEILATLWESQNRAVPPLDPETQRRLRSVIFWHGVTIQRSRDLAASAQGGDLPESPEVLVKALMLRAVVASARNSHAVLQDVISQGVLGLSSLGSRRRTNQLRRRDAKDDAFRRKLIAELLHSHADVIENTFGNYPRHWRALRWLRVKWRRAFFA